VISECSVETGDQSGLRLSASIGLVQINQDTSNEEAVLTEADHAMYADKTQATPTAKRPPTHERPDRRAPEAP
jgi:GGDEF domain-containing protein